VVLLQHNGGTLWYRQQWSQCRDGTARLRYLCVINIQGMPIKNNPLKSIVHFRQMYHKFEPIFQNSCMNIRTTYPAYYWNNWYGSIDTATAVYRYSQATKFAPTLPHYVPASSVEVPEEPMYIYCCQWRAKKNSKLLTVGSGEGAVPTPSVKINCKNNTATAAWTLNDKLPPSILHVFRLCCLLPSFGDFHLCGCYLPSLSSLR